MDMHADDVSPGDTNPHVFIIDDDIMLCQTIAEIAKRMGILSTGISRSGDFFSQYKLLKPSHIMVDLFMPDYDGFELIKYLRNIECHAQIIVMTGGDARLLNAASLVAHGYGMANVSTIRKPLNVEDVRAFLSSSKAYALADLKA